jgi:hypothetical protein
MALLSESGSGSMALTLEAVDASYQQTCRQCREILLMSSVMGAKSANGLVDKLKYPTVIAFLSTTEKASFPSIR